MNKSTATLKERLEDWTSWDLASHTLGSCLGFWNDFGAPTGFDPWHGVKGVIWSSTPLGECLYETLEKLVNIGMLERRNEPDVEYRWNPNYKENYEG